MNTSVASAPALQAKAERSIGARDTHRRDLDGLRALAALSVVACHTFPSLPGGGNGVDMFFVLSGFLISGILLRALLQETFSFADFYARRIKRIFPALIVVLLTVWLVGSVLLLPDEYRRLGKDIATSAAFTHYLFWWREPYWYPLEVDLGGTALNHLWSLGVEEQFYLLWPLLLQVIWTLSKHRIQYVAAAVAAITFASLALHVAGHYGVVTGFVPWRGMAELSAGGLLACYQTGELSLANRLPPLLNRIARALKWLVNRHVAGSAATALLAVAIAGNPFESIFADRWALAPAAGVLLLIAAGSRSVINRHLFGSAPLVFVGQISYPLYLWHFPVLLFVWILAWDRHLSPTTLFEIVAATSLVLALLTYQFVEVPVRFRKSTRAAVATLVVLMLLCGAIGIGVFQGTIRPIAGLRGDNPVRSTMEISTRDGVRTLGRGSRHVLFVGDSTMQQYYPRIEKLISAGAPRAHQAIFVTKFGCAPGIVEVHISGGKEQAACRQHLSRAFAYAADPDLDAVVIAASWYANLVAVGDLHDLSSIGTVIPLKANADQAFEGLRKVISDFTRAGKRVYLVLNLPVGARLDPRAQVSRAKLALLMGPQTYEEPSTRDVTAALEPISSRLRRIAAQTGATVIDPLRSLCNETSCPSVSERGESMYRDLWHLRPSYVRDHVTYLDEVMLSREP